jgi:hypothetical protein
VNLHQFRCVQQFRCDLYDDERLGNMLGDRQSGRNSNYAAAPQVTRTVSATPAAQTVTFTTSPPASAAYKSSFTVAASASSGLAVTFISSGACSNSGATYTMTGATGTCSVIANQAGNSNYSAAAQLTKSVTATQAPQTIVFTTSPPATAAYKTSFTVAATGGASGKRGHLHQFRCVQQLRRNLYGDQRHRHVLGDCQPGGQL